MIFKENLDYKHGFSDKNTDYQYGFFENIWFVDTYFVILQPKLIIR